MAHAKDTFFSSKSSSKGCSSFFVYIPKRWAEHRKDKNIGVIVYDLSNKHDQEEYENQRLSINWD